MAGGVAVRGNLLCVTWSAARGHVFLFDVEAQQRVSAWTLPVGPSGYSDAAGVAMDEHYHLFVADPHNDRVRHFNAFGRLLAEFGAPPPESGDVSRDRPGVLDRPHAVAVRGDLLYVAAGDQPRRRGVQRFSRQGTLLRPLASRGDSEASFGAPRGIWADDAGVLVADTLHGTIQCFRGDATFVRELRCAAPGTLARPTALLRLADGRVLFVDHGDAAGVRAFDAAGVPMALPDEWAQHCVEPLGLALASNGAIYVLDKLGERVLRFTRELRFDTVVIDLAELLDDAPNS